MRGKWETTDVDSNKNIFFFKKKESSSTERGHGNMDEFGGSFLLK